MSQATAAQALARGAEALGRDDYRRAALSALGAFDAPAPTGVAAGGQYVMYSFDPGLRILNGFLQSVIGLHDVADLTGSTRARRLYRPASAPPAAPSPRTTPAPGRATRSAAASPRCATTSSSRASWTACARARAGPSTAAPARASPATSASRRGSAWPSGAARAPGAHRAHVLALQGVRRRRLAAGTAAPAHDGAAPARPATATSGRRRARALRVTVVAAGPRGPHATRAAVHVKAKPSPAQAQKAKDGRSASAIVRARAAGAGAPTRRRSAAASAPRAPRAASPW